MPEDRNAVLLRATYDILKQCQEGPYVIDPMTITAYYDGTHCDGSCLLGDIADALGFDKDQPPLAGDCKMCGGAGRISYGDTCKQCDGTGNS